MTACRFVPVALQAIAFDCDSNAVKEEHGTPDLISRLVTISDQSYGLVTALCVNLLHNPIDMVLYCELGQIQI